MNPTAVPRHDPRSRPYRPFGGALSLFHCQDPEVLLDGPAGTGKSRALLEKIHLCMMKYPGARGLIVRKTRASMTDSVLVTFEEKVIHEGDTIRENAIRRVRQSYNYPNGSELVVGGMDNAGKVMSTEYDIIGVFEGTELLEDDWERLTTRLRNGVMPYQQIVGDCNPAGPQHWLNQRCIAGKTTRLLSRHVDNPSVTLLYLSRLQALTGARRLRLYDGKWAAQEGLVYEEWSDANLIDEMPAGWESWTRFRAIDFGYTNPFVCQWFAKDPDGRLYLYREIYKSKRIVEDHARAIVRLSEGERIEATVADHDAEDRATLERHGVRTVPARKDIGQGIQAVQARIRAAGDGRPRLFVLRDALVEADSELIEAKKAYSTEQEFGEYVWPKPRQPRESTDGKALKEVPVDDNNHGMDALRYMVMHLDVPHTVTPRPNFGRNRSVRVP